VYKCTANPHILQYTVGNTLCRQNSAETKLNSGRLGASGRLGEASFGRFAPRRAGPPLVAKTGRSKIKKWCVTETAIVRNEDLNDEPVDLRQSRKDCLVTNAAPNATHTQTQCKAAPFR
jgi:hypothetical protein